MDIDDEKKKRRSIYNKIRYEQKKEEILKYRRERYMKSKENNEKLSILTGHFIINFD